MIRFGGFLIAAFTTGVSYSETQFVLNTNPGDVIKNYNPTPFDSNKYDENIHMKSVYVGLLSGTLFPLYWANRVYFNNNKSRSMWYLNHLPFIN